MAQLTHNLPDGANLGACRVRLYRTAVSAASVTPDPERAIADASAGARLALIAESFARLTGRALVAPDGDLAQALWTAPRAIVAHGREADPVFFYGNRLALDRFEIRAEDFICLPSRFSAEPLARDERARLLARVSAHGFIDDYDGVRISAAGRRFRIERATVWNLTGADGVVQGQAATFEHWTRLD